MLFNTLCSVEEEVSHRSPLNSLSWLWKGLPAYISLPSALSGIVFIGQPLCKAASHLFRVFPCPGTAGPFYLPRFMWGQQKLLCQHWSSISLSAQLLPLLPSTGVAFNEYLHIKLQSQNVFPENPNINTRLK